MHPNPFRVFQVHPPRTFPAGTTRNINCTSENYGIAKAQTALHHWQDPSLAGTIQHRWMRQKNNVKPEIIWSQLRRRFTPSPGFEDFLEIGVTNGWYDTARPLDSDV